MAFLVDDVYVYVQPPQPVLPAGQLAFVGAAAGMAQWGPVGVPLTANTPQQAVANWGVPINVGRDLVQDAALFLAQLPLGGFVGVRVSDGTDAVATGTLKDTAPATGLTISAKYTGTFGNNIVVTLGPGSNSGTVKTWKVTVQAGNNQPEIWDRIPGNVTGATTWQAIANAINLGQGGFNPASQYITAALGASALFPATGTQTLALTGGTNGGVITTAQAIGTDGGAGLRTGMYALRQQNMDLVWLAGNTDSTSWSTLLAFAKSEFAMAIGSLPAGTTIASAITAKLTAGIDDPYMILLLSEITYLDSYVQANVTLPATPVVAGLICSIQPQESPGNRVVNGILGTEQTLGANPQPFSATDLGTLEANGINVITGRIPSANAFGLRHGKNTSSNFATSEIPYGRKTNDIVRDLKGPVMGQFINRLQTIRANDPLRLAVLAAIDDYFGPQVSADEIDTYSRQCDLGNNPVANIRNGLLRADIIVEYLSVVDQFSIFLTAGQTVDVVAASAANNQAIQ